MKQIILTTMLVAITASGASAHWSSPKHNMHHIKIAFKKGNKAVKKKEQELSGAEAVL